MSKETMITNLLDVGKSDEREAALLMSLSRSLVEMIYVSRGGCCPLPAPTAATNPGSEE